LIRALLIELKKTKVDVEIAMGGIDSMLKSQELLFGFVTPSAPNPTNMTRIVSLTPGVLVTIAALRWLSTSLGSRRGAALGSAKGRMLGILGNADRILWAAQPSEHGALYYRDYGLLLCEAQVLRRIARDVPAPGVQAVPRRPGGADGHWGRGGAAEGSDSADQHAVLEVVLLRLGNSRAERRN
jgi:nuclear-control-of-ATPase protein 2